MAKYISKDDAINFEMEVDAELDEIQPITKGMALYSEYLEQLPAITITRCKDCIHLTPSAWAIGKGHCCRLGIMRPFEWFCAYGEEE